MFKQKFKKDPHPNVGFTARREIVRAVLQNRAPMFHGGCSGCVFRLQATTHAGIEYCSGCLYMNFDSKKPDLGWRESDYEHAEFEENDYERPDPAVSVNSALVNNMKGNLP